MFGFSRFHGKAIVMGGRLQEVAVVRLMRKIESVLFVIDVIDRLWIFMYLYILYLWQLYISTENMQNALNMQKYTEYST